MTTPNGYLSQATTKSAPAVATLATLEEIRAEVARHVDAPVRWDRARKRFGAVHWRRDRLTRQPTPNLSFSKVLWPHMSPEQRRNTVLHEVAHVLAGVGQGHNAKWRRIHLSLGGDGRRCSDVDIPMEAVRPKYLGTCPNGHQSSRTRISARTRPESCAKCSPRFNEKYLITWKQQY